VQLPTLTEIRDALSGKILIDVTVPLVPPRVTRVQLPEGGSAVVKAQALLGETVKVVAAFQNISAAHLGQPDHAVDCDVLVCGDDKAARQAAIRLAEAAGLRGWHAGPLANAAAAEALTSVLMFINRNYGIDGAGIRITGTPTKAPA
jgi:NADPH-dependent F420 reductase